MVAPVYKIVISKSQLQLRLFKNDQLLLSAPVSLGRPETPTPTGSFKVSKAVTKDSWLHQQYRRWRNVWPKISTLANIVKKVSFIYRRLSGKTDAVGEILFVLSDTAGKYIKEGIHGGLTDFSQPGYNTNGCIRLNRRDLLPLKDIPINTPVLIQD